MNKIFIILLLIILGAILFIGGGWVGMFYNVSKISTKDVLFSNLTSPVISSISAYGKVEKIEGRNITLSNAGKSIKINILQNCSISYFGLPDKSAKFEDIKEGNELNVILKILPDSNLQGVKINIVK